MRLSLIYSMTTSDERKTTKKKAKYISLSYEKSFNKKTARDKKIKVWLYTQICSPTIGVTSCASLVGDGSASENSLKLTFPEC